MCGPASPIFLLGVRCPQRAYSGLYVPSFALVGGPAPVLPTILWGRELNCPQKAQVLGLPAGPVVGNLPANAGNAGLIPVPGGFHMLWGNWARAPQLLKPTCSEVHVLQLEKQLQQEACA